MAGIDLNTAQTHLDKWLTIAAGLDEVSSFTYRDRTYTKHDLESINKQITFWERKVLSLSRRGRVSASRLIVHD